MLSDEQLVKNGFNQWIYIDKNDYIGKEIIKKGMYDKSSIYFMRSLLKKINSPIVLDIGANIGNHLIPILPFVQKAIAFEPQPEIFNKLKRTINKNNFTNCIVENYGLGCKDENLIFYQDNEGNNGSSSFVKEHAPTVKNNILNLPIKNGDTVLNSLKIQKLDFIKMDIEGFEYEALKGIKNNIKKNSPIILMEWRKITRQAFSENNIFNNILIDYKILALENKIWKIAPIFWIIGRFFAKYIQEQSKIYKFIKPYKLIKFNYDEDYNNILLFKKKHENIVNKMIKFL